MQKNQIGKFISAFKQQNSSLFADDALNHSVILGVSGGLDSIVLLQLMLESTRNSKKIIVGHVDYQLRDDSYLETELLENLSKKNDFILETIKWDSVTKNVGTENSAREFRLSFFERLAKKYQANHILLAHQANEQAETILLKIIRGGDWRELAGMTYRRKLNDESDIEIIRPLLAFRKETLKVFALDRSLNWIEDETNQDANYTLRNKIRKEILPLLKTLNPNIVDNLLSVGKQLEDVNQNQLPELIKEYLIRQYPGAPFKQNQIDSFTNLLLNDKKPHGKIDLERGVKLIKNNGEIRIDK